MIRLTLLAVLIGSAASALVIDNNSFILYNKYYYKSKLVQFGTGHENDLGTTDGDVDSNQVWIFDPHPTQTGCYYIENEKYGWRIADRFGDLIIYNGNYFDDQLFKLIPHGDNYYEIKSCRHTVDSLAKFDNRDKGVGFKARREHEDQHWKFVPRHTGAVRTETVFHYDNRQGSYPITKSYEVTKGLIRSSSSSVRNLSSFTLSLEASVEYMAVSASVAAEFHTEIESTTTQSTESSWSKTEYISFTIPAGKNYEVMQHVVSFSSPVPGDSATLKSKIKIFESTTDTFSDPDGFIINT